MNDFLWLVHVLLLELRDNVHYVLANSDDAVSYTHLDVYKRQASSIFASFRKYSYRLTALSAGNLTHTDNERY